MSTLATGAAALVLAGLPGLAQAQEAVDERTGPVAYANAAALAIGDDGGSVISETQRSPLVPGTSTLAQNRFALPGSDGERDAVGPNYLLTLGTFADGESPFPDGVASRSHRVTATLTDTTVPTATAEANFALRDVAADATVVAFEGARSHVECAGADSVTSSTTAERLWVRDEDGELEPVDLPEGDEPLTLSNRRFGPPMEVPDAAPETTVSDVAISRVTAFEQLLRQEQWRDGDVTAAAGWQVEIVSHVRDAEGADLRDVTTRLVLGGVSCSLPDGFTPATADRADLADETTPPQVPVKIPAGATAQDTANGALPWGLGLLGGGLVLGTVALLLVRRRTAAPVAERER
ncbi:hypothetical protein ABZ863_12625 [Saccharomonospora sp. NPDC046836]|uniref:hypothetical protein n=1 Tax=Saccharomonospora sp. NPDC046836 TaxID=3156921 RepID=UPI0033C93496